MYVHYFRFLLLALLYFSRTCKFKSRMQGSLAVVELDAFFIPSMRTKEKRKEKSRLSVPSQGAPTTEKRQPSFMPLSKKRKIHCILYIHDLLDQVAGNDFEYILGGFVCIGWIFGHRLPNLTMLGFSYNALGQYV